MFCLKHLLASKIQIEKFLKEICIYLLKQYSKNSKNVKYHYVIISCFNIIVVLLWWKISIFSYSIFSHNHFEIISDMLIWLKKIFLLISMLKIVFCGNHIFFWILWWIEGSIEHHLFDIFYKIIHIFTVIFDKFYVSLLNKNISLY